MKNTISMEQNPLVSIVIPVYNSEKYLQECIEAVINQTYPKIEIIVVNDASTDSSLEILEKYSDKIKIISRQNVGTIASARNVGIKNATGEWIKQQDSDDIMYPNAIEDLVGEAKLVEDKKRVIFYGNVHRISPDGKVVYKTDYPDYGVFKKFDLDVVALNHHFVHHTACLIHSSAFKEFGLFDEELMIAEDQELLVRYIVLNNCILRFVNTVVVKIRSHTNSLSRSNRNHCKRYNDLAQEKIFAKLDSDRIKQYQKGLEEFQKNKPAHLKAKEFFLEGIVDKMPTFISKRITVFYEVNKGKIGSVVKKILNS